MRTIQTISRNIQVEFKEISFDDLASFENLENDEAEENESPKEE